LAKAKVKATDAGADPDQGLVDQLVLVESAINPFLVNAKITSTYAKATAPRADYAAIVVGLSQNFRDIAAGDMRRPKAMLYAQTVALQAVFALLMQRAMGTNCVPRCNEPTLALALKCQAQCRATLETLGEMVNPKSATFVQQANIAGQQLVTNHSRARGRRGKTRDEPKELLMEATRETLDATGKGAAGAVDIRLGTVDARDRPANHRGQGPELP
jgi:putative sterol carrier protein